MLCGNATALPARAARRPRALSGRGIRRGQITVATRSHAHISSVVRDPTHLHDVAPRLERLERLGVPTNGKLTRRQISAHGADAFCR